MIQALLILDSSFNPPTKAHQEMLKIGQEMYPNHKPILLISTFNADKGSMQESDLMNRTLLMKTAFPKIKIEIISKPFFTQKSIEIRKRYPFVNINNIVYIVGTDTLERILNPKYYSDFNGEMDQFFSTSSLLCFQRDHISKFRAIDRWMSKIRMVNQVDKEDSQISSSRAREALLKNRDDVDKLKEYLPDSVIDLILAKGLYSS